MRMSNILKNMAKILAIAELVGPAAAKDMIENQANKIVVEDAEKAIKRLSDSQKKELQKQHDDADSKVTDSEKSQEVSKQEIDSNETTANEDQSSTSEIKDTVEISQSAQKSLEFETTNNSES